MDIVKKYKLDLIFDDIEIVISSKISKEITESIFNDESLSDAEQQIELQEWHRKKKYEDLLERVEYKLEEMTSMYVLGMVTHDQLQQHKLLIYNLKQELKNLEK